MQEAIDKFTDCLAIDPMNKGFNKQILFNRSVAWTKVGKHMNALKDLNEVLVIDPKNQKFLMKRGEVNLTLENFDEAVRDFEAAREIDPSKASFLTYFRCFQCSRKTETCKIGTEKEQEKRLLQNSCYRKRMQ